MREMDFSTSFELWLAGCSALFGAVGMLLYDLFRIWRLMLPAGRLSIVLQDLLYWTLLSAGCFFFLLYANKGQPRVFILVCALLGAWLYHMSLGRLVMTAGGWFAKRVRAACKIVRNFFEKAIVMLGKICNNKGSETRRG